MIRKNKQNQDQESSVGHQEPKSSLANKATKAVALGAAGLALTAGARHLVNSGETTKAEYPVSPPANILHQVEIERPSFIKPEKPQLVPEKFDDGVLPGTGSPGDLDKGSLVPDSEGALDERPEAGHSPVEPGLPPSPPMTPEMGRPEPANDLPGPKSPPIPPEYY